MVGDEPELIEQKPYDGYWAEIILHADNDGKFVKLEIDDKLSESIVEVDLWVKAGDVVKGFEGANDAIGTLVLKFADAISMEDVLREQKEWLKVIVE